jgi:predicted  nucleic acid-binding Zn-ribbon protein
VLKIFTMSGQGYEELKLLNRKIDELVNNYNNLKHECENLKTEKEALKSSLLDRETEMKELEKKYERVKLSGALLGDGENATEAKKKITELVREIDNCIALLDR